MSPQTGVLRTALIVLATGGLTYVVTNRLGQPPAVCLTLAVLLGGFVLIVRFLIDFEKRLAVVEKLQADGVNDMKKLVGDAFTEISDATALFGLIEASALQTDLVTQLVRNSTTISPGSPPIVYQFAQSKIKEMSDFLKQLAEGGTVTYYGEDRDWLLGLTRNATESVDAISLAAVDHDLWRSEIGQRYLDAQRRAARAGKRVRRIFVLDSPAMEHDQDLRRVYLEQREMLIEVRVLDRAAVPTPPSRSRCATSSSSTTSWRTRRRRPPPTRKWRRWPRPDWF
ncbi:DUF6879 family protein [Actinoplanes sp. CA-131856]